MQDPQKSHSVIVLICFSQLLLQNKLHRIYDAILWVNNLSWTCFFFVFFFLLVLVGVLDASAVSYQVSQKLFGEAKARMVVSALSGLSSYFRLTRLCSVVVTGLQNSNLQCTHALQSSVCSVFANVSLTNAIHFKRHSE